MSKIIHMALSVDGALRQPKTWINCITVEGKRLTTERQVKEFLQYHLALGHELLPLCDCEGFDYKLGCPGHLIEKGGVE